MPAPGRARRSSGRSRRSPRGTATSARSRAVRADAARAEAAALAGRSELRRLPLAGVPVAVKELLDPDGDHVVVRRLREAGAVVVGSTRMPQACLWPATDGEGTRDPWITRNPWSRDYSAGGSSGGAGAAVAAGLVPMAHGTDGLGSVRIPASCCGLVGVKPGRGVVPVELGGGDWFGLTEHGVLATTVADAALMLSVLAADPMLARVEEPEESLRIAVAVNPPLAGVPVDTEVVRATFAVAAALRAAGDRVERTAVPYPVTLGAALSARWFGAAREEIADLTAQHPGHRIEPRARRHAALDRATRPLLRRASAAVVGAAGADLLRPVRRARDAAARHRAAAGARVERAGLGDERRGERPVDRRLRRRLEPRRLPGADRAGRRPPAHRAADRRPARRAARLGAAAARRRVDDRAAAAVAAGGARLRLALSRSRGAPGAAAGCRTASRTRPRGARRSDFVDVLPAEVVEQPPPVGGVAVPRVGVGHQPVLGNAEEPGEGAGDVVRHVIQA